MIVNVCDSPAIYAINVTVIQRHQIAFSYCFGNPPPCGWPTALDMPLPHFVGVPIHNLVSLHDLMHAPAANTEYPGQFAQALASPSQFLDLGAAPSLFLEPEHVGFPLHGA